MKIKYINGITVYYLSCIYTDALKMEVEVDSDLTIKQEESTADDDDHNPITDVPLLTPHSSTARSPVDMPLPSLELPADDAAVLPPVSISESPASGSDLPSNLSDKYLSTGNGATSVESKLSTEEPSSALEELLASVNVEPASLVPELQTTSVFCDSSQDDEKKISSTSSGANLAAPPSATHSDQLLRCSEHKNWDLHNIPDCSEGIMDAAEQDFLDNLVLLHTSSINITANINHDSNSGSSEPAAALSNVPTQTVSQLQVSTD